MPESDSQVIPRAQSEVVRVSESAVGSVRADHVVSNRTTVRRTDAQRVEADRSLMLVNRTDHLQVTRGAVGGATSVRTQVRTGRWASTSAATRGWRM